VDREYSIRLVARQEGVEYRTATEVYRFDVLLHEGEWRLYLPGSRGEACTPHELTEREAAEILPRIEAYLRQDRLFGVPFGTRPVRICRHPAP
jgi:hypothetical protein